MSVQNKSAYSVKEVADMLDVSTKTIYRMLEDQRLPGFKVGRIWRIPEPVIQKLLEGKQILDQATEGYQQEEGREFSQEEIDRFLKEDDID